jgi:hypothetical protein
MDVLCRLSYQGVRGRSVASASRRVEPTIRSVRREALAMLYLVVGAGFEPAKA